MPIDATVTVLQGVREAATSVLELDEDEDQLDSGLLSDLGAYELDVLKIGLKLGAECDI